MKGATLKVVEVPITSVTGHIVKTSKRTIERLGTLVDVPDGDLVRVLYGEGPEDCEHYFTLGVIKPDGMVDCIVVDFDDHWRWFGEYYGYPDCCVEQFCEESDAWGITHETPFTGTGFVPCTSCASTSSLKDLVTTIGKNRKSAIPFLLPISVIDKMFELVIYILNQGKSHD